MIYVVESTHFCGRSTDGLGKALYRFAFGTTKNGHGRRSSLSGLENTSVLLQMYKHEDQNQNSAS